MARDQQIVRMCGRWYVATLHGQKWHVPDGSGGWGYARTATEAAEIAISAGASGRRATMRESKDHLDRKEEDQVKTTTDTEKVLRMLRELLMEKRKHVESRETANASPEIRKAYLDGVSTGHYDAIRVIDAVLGEK